MKQEQSMIYQYQLFIRIWHALNAVFFLVLILTGLSMQYSNPDNAMIPFSISVQLHNICGIGLTIDYLLFFIGNWVSGNFRHYRIQRKGLMNKLIRQGRYYVWGYFMKEEHPFPLNEETKFNPLQALIYTMALYIGVPVLIISGIGLLFPETVLSKLFGISGLVWTDLVHVISGFFLSVFMFVHIYLCSIGAKPLSNYRAILTGWHEKH